MKKSWTAILLAMSAWGGLPNADEWRGIANRVGHYHFGRGLCDTPHDFGRMGGTPPHPGLPPFLNSQIL